MKFLHTSDWHVGKTIRGHSRADEHLAVFAEIEKIAAENEVDFILVAGDLYETISPSPQSEQIVYSTLLNLSKIAPVVIISGNHDNANRIKAVKPLLEMSNIHTSCEVKSPQEGGVLELETKSGELAKIAFLPFISQRAIVKIASLMDNPAFKNSQIYRERISHIISILCEDFDEKSVNILLGHCFVNGAMSGGGERPAHLQDAYSIDTHDIPQSLTYAALGHLHRPQKIAGATAIHYCGSPIQMDFGEEAQTKQVNIVEAQAGLPAKVTPVELETGKSLITITGTLADVLAAEVDVNNCWIRVRLKEQFAIGLAEQVKEYFGSAVVDVSLVKSNEVTQKSKKTKAGRTPQELFGDYLSELEQTSDALTTQFDILLDEVSSGSSEVPITQETLLPENESSETNKPNEPDVLVASKVAEK